jgi:hypothetical protein
VFVIWPRAPGLLPFLEGLGRGLVTTGGPGSGFILLGSEEVETRESSFRDAGGRSRGGAWKDLPHQMVTILTGKKVTDLIVGPDGKLAHLALQLAVKTGIRVVLISCPDPSALALPIRGVTSLPHIHAGAPRADPPSAPDFRVLGSELSHELQGQT